MNKEEVVEALERQREYHREKLEYCAPWQADHLDSVEMLTLIDYLLATMDTMFDVRDRPPQTFCLPIRPANEP